jgi:hypothetical protein
VQPDIRFPVTYPCPSCGEPLEAITDEWQDWMRCPSCGRAGRPPLPRRAARPAEDVLYIGTFSTGPGSPNGNGSSDRYGPIGYGPGGFPATDMPDPAAGSGSGRRVAIGLMFFLSAFLALVSVVQRNPTQAGVFGFVALILILFLAQSSRRV